VRDPEADVRLQYQQLTWNPPLAEGVFNQAPPAGMRIENVACAESDGP
jgi:hypothetical protein